MPHLPPHSTNGSSNGHGAGIAPGSGVLTDEQTFARRDRALADADQTWSESDQTLADADQTSSDGYQTSADSDQLAADRDQAASDRDLSAGVDARAHDLSRGMRERSAVQREQSAQARLDAAHDRDRIARVRDLAALARDTAGDARDLAMAQRDAAHERATGAHLRVSGAEVVMRAAEQRKRAAELREVASEQRVLAAADRQQAAEDRDHATSERLRALADLEALAGQLAIAALDPLTGASTRAAGLLDLDHELDRCRRTNAPLVVAYVDVVGLKTVNDSDGHAAGDELLKHVVALIAERLRPYDLIIRLGGDEFLCVVSNMVLADARERFNVIVTELAAEPKPEALTVGFAQFTGADTTAELIARADGELLEDRRANLGRRPDPPDDRGLGYV
jgi:diguanylate cyclase (GGDEF)-like protein